MIHIITGTKAQLIKMAPIMRVLQDNNIEYNHISTGQHKATMQEISENFGIKQPDIELYNGKDITSIISMFSWSIKILYKTSKNKRKIFRNDENGIALIHGDTFSTAIGALMAKLAGVKVGHVESGLRSFNLFQPFPEELTRLLTFRLSDVAFCPGQVNMDNLKSYKHLKINTGDNSLLDSLKLSLPAIVNIENVAIPSKSYGVVSVHRFENFNSYTNVLKIVEIIEQIAKQHSLIFILHKITEKKLLKYNLLERIKYNSNIEVRGRYDYFSFIKLVYNSCFLVSDGGSNQEECYYLGKPILILRNVSERSEGLGYNAVISKFDSKIITEFLQNLNHYTHPVMQLTSSPSKIIADYCSENYN